MAASKRNQSKAILYGRRLEAAIRTADGVRTETHVFIGASRNNSVETDGHNRWRSGKRIGGFKTYTHRSLNQDLD